MREGMLTNAPEKRHPGSPLVPDPLFHVVARARTHTRPRPRLAAVASNNLQEAGQLRLRSCFHGACYSANPPPHPSLACPLPFPLL